MFSLDELSAQINDLRQGNLSLDDFEDWFSDNSGGAYAADDDRISEAYSCIEALFSEYHFERVPAAEISEKLEGVIRPFVAPVRVYGNDVQLSYGNPETGTSSASPAADLVYSERLVYRPPVSVLSAASVVAIGY
jgi:hypothetical protein